MNIPIKYILRTVVVMGLRVTQILYSERVYILFTEIDYSISVAIFMPNCTFEANFSRNAIPKTIEEIDVELTNDGYLDDESRIAEVILRSITIASNIANGIIDKELGISEIAYSILYAYAKNQGLDSLHDVEGLVGCLADDNLFLNPYTDRKSFEQASTTMRKLVSTILDYEDAIDITPPKPTIH